MTKLLPNNYAQPLDFARSWARVVRGEPPLPPTRENWIEQIISALPRYTEDMEHPNNPYYAAIHAEYCDTATRELINLCVDTVIHELMPRYLAALRQLNAVMPKAYQLRVDADSDIAPISMQYQSYGTMLHKVVLSNDQPAVLVPRCGFNIATRHYQRRNFATWLCIPSGNLVDAIADVRFQELPLIMAGRTLLKRFAPHWRQRVPTALCTAVRNREAREALFARITAESKHLHETYLCHGVDLTATG